MMSLAGESSKHRPHPRLQKMGRKGKVRSLRARGQPETHERGLGGRAELVGLVETAGK